MKYLMNVLAIMVALSIPMGASAQDGVVPPTDVVAEASDAGVVEAAETDAAVVAVPEENVLAPLTLEAPPVSLDPTTITVPETPQDVADNVTFLIRAAKNGQWSLFAGLLIMLLIFIANKAGLKDKLGDKALPWVAVALGTLTSIAIMLVSGLPVEEAITGGLMAGLAATGFWELIFKHFMNPDPAKPTV